MALPFPPSYGDSNHDPNYGWRRASGITSPGKPDAFEEAAELAFPRTRFAFSDEVEKETQDLKPEIAPSEFLRDSYHHVPAPENFYRHMSSRKTHQPQHDFLRLALFSKDGRNLGPV